MLIKMLFEVISLLFHSRSLKTKVDSGYGRAGRQRPTSWCCRGSVETVYILFDTP